MFFLFLLTKVKPSKKASATLLRCSRVRANVDEIYIVAASLLGIDLSQADAV